MHRSLFALSRFLVSMSVMTTAAAGLAAPAMAEPLAAVDDFGWLSGDWRRCRDDEIVEERWLGPRGGLMVGVNLTSRVGGRTSFETLRIARDADDGRPTLWASPMGRPAVPFRLLDGGPGRAVFANPEHGFPARIVYRRDDDALLARIEGTAADGGPRAVEWRFESGTAAGCPPPR